MARLQVEVTTSKNNQTQRAKKIITNYTKNMEILKNGAFTWFC